MARAGREPSADELAGCDRAAADIRAVLDDELDGGGGVGEYDGGLAGPEAARHDLFGTGAEGEGACGGAAKAAARLQAFVAVDDGPCDAVGAGHGPGVCQHLAGIAGGGREAAVCGFGKRHLPGGCSQQDGVAFGAGGCRKFGAGDPVCDGIGPDG